LICGFERARVGGREGGELLRLDGGLLFVVFFDVLADQELGLALWDL
jgi:hypothetical protein